MTVPGQGTAGRIQDSTLMFKDISRSSEGIGTAQDCLNLGSQHIQIKWFCNKIVCTTAHCHDHIHIVRCRGNKDDRYLGNLTNLLTPVKTVIKRQFQIQQDKLRIFVSKFLYDIGKIFCAGDIISPGTEILFQKVGDDLIIFYDENTVHGQSFLVKLYFMLIITCL